MYFNDFIDHIGKERLEMQIKEDFATSIGDKIAPALELYEVDTEEQNKVFYETAIVITSIEKWHNLVNMVNGLLSGSNPETKAWARDILKQVEQ